MAFFADSLLSICSSENKHENHQFSQSPKQKRAAENTAIDKQPHRELSAFLLNELRATDFFQDTYVASTHSVELQYDLDELILLSKQMQQKNNATLAIRDGQPSKTEGSHKPLKRNQQPVAEKCVSPKSSALNHEPYSLLGYGVRSNVRRSAKRYVTTLKYKHQQPVNTSEVQRSLSSGNGLFSGKRTTRPKLWSHIERPVPKKHSCVMLPVRSPAQKSILNLNKSAEYYCFEKTHPNIELVRSDTLFPKRVAKVDAKPSVALCSSEFSEETLKESALGESVYLVEIKELFEKEAEVKNPTWHHVLEQKLGGSPKTNETHDKGVQIEFVEEKLEPDRGQQQISSFIGTSRAPNVIQVLPFLNIRRECRIQKLPDVSIASGDGFMSSKSNNIKVVYTKHADLSESTNPSTYPIQNMQPEVVSSEVSNSKLISNPYLQPFANVIAASEVKASEEHNEEKPPSQRSNSEDGYSTTFEVTSSLHDSMTSQPITDDEKASLVEHSRSQSKSQSQIVSPLADSNCQRTDRSHQTFLSEAEFQLSQSTTDSQRLHSVQNSQNLISPHFQRLHFRDTGRLLTKLECQNQASPSISNGLSRKFGHSFADNTVNNLKPLESPPLPKSSFAYDTQSDTQLIQNEIEDEDLEIELPVFLEATPVISSAFLQIIDRIVESSPEDQKQDAFLPESSTTEPTCNVSTMAFGKSAIFEMVHEDWTEPKRTQIDNAVQTCSTNERSDFQNSAVQTDPFAGGHLPIEHWEADSIASAHMVFDRIRNDKIDHWQRQTDDALQFRQIPCMAPIHTRRQTTGISQPTAKHQSIQYLPPSPSVKPIQSHMPENKERPRQYRRRTVTHSLESSSSLSGVNHYTPLPSHRQHMLPSERLTSYKQLQRRSLQFQDNPKVLRTIESIRNEAAEGNIGHIRSLNSTYRSAYEEDDIEIAAQRFLNSVNKARISKQRTRPSIDWYRTESSSTQDSSSNKFYSLDGTPSSESASHIDERYLCTNSETTSLSVNRSPVRRCLSFRSSGNEISIVQSARNDLFSGKSSLRRKCNRKIYLPKVVAEKAPETSSFEITTTSSSIENSEGKIKSIIGDEAYAGLRKNSTSSSIEKQMEKFRLTEGAYDQRLSAEQNDTTNQPKDTFGIYPPRNDLQRLIVLDRSTNHIESTDPKSFSDYQSSCDFKSSSDQQSLPDHHLAASHLLSSCSTLNRNSDAHNMLDQILSGDWTNQISTSSSLEKQMTRMELLDVAINNGNSHSDTETCDSMGAARLREHNKRIHNK